MWFGWRCLCCVLGSLLFSLQYFITVLYSNCNGQWPTGKKIKMMMDRVRTRGRKPRRGQGESEPMDGSQETRSSEGRNFSLKFALILNDLVHADPCLVLTDTPQVGTHTHNSCGETSASVQRALYEVFNCMERKTSFSARRFPDR